MTPTREYRYLRIQFPKEVTTGLDSFLDHSLGYFKRRWSIPVSYYFRARRISRMAEKMRALNEIELTGKLTHFEKVFRKNPQPGKKEVNEALAAIGIAAGRTLNMFPYPVQYMAALILADGYLAEMATGEGKTLVVGLAGVLLGWTGKPVHLVTANDYLAQRDAEEMKPLYRRCNIEPGFVIAGMKSPERKDNYEKDVTYTTSKEMLADFLRDRLQYESINNPSRLLARDILGAGETKNPGAGNSRVMRGIHSAIIDEADSVLIDDAIVPLIISQKFKNEAFNECCRIASGIASRLKPDIDYTVKFKHRDIKFTALGLVELEKEARQLPRMWQSYRRSSELVKQALVARVFYLSGRDYVVQDGKVILVDQSTGRLKLDSTWRGGLQQAVETKEGVELSDPAQTLASLSFQKFYRLFPRLSATTGTARDSAREIWHIYRLPVISIPTNRRCRRRHLRSRYFPDLESKWEAVTAEVRRLNRKGRPVLIGTSSVSASEELARHFRKANIQFHLLNAVEHEKEAGIVALAGKKGAVTIATNMAGRGTDIKLDTGITELGGLHIIATDRMESRRVDRQLYGRAGRQGDPGSAETFVSMEDDLLKSAFSKAILKQAAKIIYYKSPIKNLVASHLTGKAQQHKEKQNFEQRKSVMEMDKWLQESLSFTGKSQI